MENATLWCQLTNIRLAADEPGSRLHRFDPHSPGRYRVNGVVQNMPEFQKAWGCKAGPPMVSENENMCRVWR